VTRHGPRGDPEIPVLVVLLARLYAFFMTLEAATVTSALGDVNKILAPSVRGQLGARGLAPGCRQ